MNVRPKLQQMALRRTLRQDLFSLSSHSTPYVVLRTLSEIQETLGRACDPTVTSDHGADLLRTRDACLDAAAVLLIAAEQAQRDHESWRDRQQ